MIIISNFKSIKKQAMGAIQSVSIERRQKIDRLVLEINKFNLLQGLGVSNSLSDLNMKLKEEDLESAINNTNLEVVTVVHSNVIISLEMLNEFELGHYYDVRRKYPSITYKFVQVVERK